MLASDFMGREGGPGGSRARFSYLFPWIELTLGILGALAILLGPPSPGSVEGQLGEAAFLCLLSLGLGLFVVRALAEAQGGSVTYAPRDPHGSVFTLSLPSARQPDPTTD